MRIRAWSLLSMRLSFILSGVEVRDMFITLLLVALREFLPGCYLCFLAAYSDLPAGVEARRGRGLCEGVPDPLRVKLQEPEPV